MKRALRTIVVLAITALLIFLFLRNSDLSRVAGVLAQTHPAWLTAAILANVGALWFRAMRWRVILDPAKPPPLSATFFATSVGYMVSMVLPIRAADVARPALLTRKTPIRFTFALGTILTERVLDLMAMLSLFLTYVLTQTPRLAQMESMKRPLVLLHTAGFITGAILVALIALVVSVYFFGHRIRVAHEYMGRILPRRARDGWMRFFDSFAGSFDLIHERHAFLKVVLFTAGVWFCLTAQLVLVLYALNHPLPYSASFLITGMAILGLVIPTPAGVGGYHKAAQIALTTFYAFDVDASVAVAFVFHLVGVAPVTVIGLLLFAREGLTWRSMSRLVEQEPEASSTSRVEE